MITDEQVEAARMEVGRLQAAVDAIHHTAAGQPMALLPGTDRQQLLFGWGCRCWQFVKTAVDLASRAALRKAQKILAGLERQLCDQIENAFEMARQMVLSRRAARREVESWNRDDDGPLRSKPLAARAQAHERGQAFGLIPAEKECPV